MATKTYILEHLGCANCASKIERKIASLPGVSEANIVYATKQLRLTAEDPDGLLPEMQKIAVSYEPDILITEQKRRSLKKAPAAVGRAPHAHKEHPHDADCGCGHHDHEEHRHSADCGCGHDHHDHHAHYHVPGHPADCQCELCRHGEEYCHICGESLANCTCKMPDADVEKAVFILENLGCANCAAKMEHKIKELPGVEYATITYATRQLRLSADNAAALLPDIQKICAAIEPDVRVIPRKKSVGKGTTQVYTLENLGCANCAAKMEAKINALDDVSSATITYTQNIIASQFPDSDLFLRTAIEYRLQNRNCNRNKGLNRFYHELCDSNIFMKTESASVGFIENINKAHKLGLSRVDVKALALANLSAVHGLHVARNEGFLDCSSEYLAETEIRLLLQSLKIGNDVIEGYIEQSREIVDRIEISVGKNFKVL